MHERKDKGYGNYCIRALHRGYKDPSYLASLGLGSQEI